MNESESTEKAIALANQTADYVTTVSKAVLGAVPYVGSLLAEVAGTIIPNQRVDRIASFAGVLNQKLAHLEQNFIRAQLTDGSDLARLLTAPGVIAHAEMPFLWPMSAGECLEGIIDLAVFDPARESWLLLDWKTNRTRADELPKLTAHYLPQLSAYWKAVSEMLRAPVAAGLYSTASGAWLPCERDSLAEAWQSLSREPEAVARALAET